MLSKRCCFQCSNFFIGIAVLFIAYQGVTGRLDVDLPFMDLIEMHQNSDSAQVELNKEKVPAVMLRLYDSWSKKKSCVNRKVLSIPVEVKETQNMIYAMSASFPPHKKNILKAELWMEYAEVENLKVTSNHLYCADINPMDSSLDVVSYTQKPKIYNEKLEFDFNITNLYLKTKSMGKSKFTFWIRMYLRKKTDNIHMNKMQAFVVVYEHNENCRSGVRKRAKRSLDDNYMSAEDLKRTVSSPDFDFSEVLGTLLKMAASGFDANDLSEHVKGLKSVTIAKVEKDNGFDQESYENSRSQSDVQSSYRESVDTPSLYQKFTRNQPLEETQSVASSLRRIAAFSTASKNVITKRSDEATIYKSIFSSSWFRGKVIRQRKSILSKQRSILTLGDYKSMESDSTVELHSNSDSFESSKLDQTKSRSATHMMTHSDFQPVPHPRVYSSRSLYNSFPPESNQRAPRQKRANCSKNQKKSETTRKSCRRSNFYIDFRDLGFDHWIIAPPDGFRSNRCTGMCRYPMADGMNATNHAILQAMASSMLGKVPSSSCVPDKLGSLTVLAADNSGELISMMSISDMIVLSCGCK